MLFFVLVDRPQVSMIDAAFFDKLVSIYTSELYRPVLILESKEHIARQVREDDGPFGGIQVIFW